MFVCNNINAQTCVSSHTNSTINFAGLRSSQQRSWKLLQKLDPELGAQLGVKKFKTGDYEWSEEMLAALVTKMQSDITPWVPAQTLPPYGYDTKSAEDMTLWSVRRQAGLSWVKSDTAIEFAKSVYKQYASIFAATTKKQGRTDVGKCLEQFYMKRRIVEQGIIRVQLRQLLTPIHTGGGDVVDSFSFVVRELLRSIFNFFGSQVRVRAPTVMKPRFKDREDMVGLICIFEVCIYVSVLLIAMRFCRPKRTTSAE